MYSVLVGWGEGPELINRMEAVMALSEHEQRLLDQLEQQLHADDPSWAPRDAARANGGRKQREAVGAHDGGRVSFQTAAQAGT